MRTADERRSPSTAYPWHDAVQSVTDTAGSRSTIRGTRAGPVTRSFANVADLVVVALVVVAGYAAIAATRFLLGPITFRFPAPVPDDAAPPRPLRPGVVLRHHLGRDRRHLRRPVARAPREP